MPPNSHHLNFLLINTTSTLNLKIPVHVYSCPKNGGIFTKYSRLKQNSHKAQANELLFPQKKQLIMPR